MVNKSPTHLAPDRDEPSDTGARNLIRLARVETVTAAVIVAVMLVLVVIEPDILEAPFENGRTLLFTVGGTVIAALAWIAMLRLRVPPAIRVVVLVVPFVVVNWWLLSPYFVDDVVDESFAVSIVDQQTTAVDDVGAGSQEAAPSEAASDEATAPDPAPTSTEPAPPTEATVTAEPTDPTVAPPPPPSGPVLLGAGQFVGLAGHSGTGDAGIFQNPDGSLVLRFENFDIENGPDLEVYLVPGSDQTTLADGSIALGALKGNVGDQNYELPPGTDLASGGYTALVWCEAFSVEFVGATIII